jgi:D-3-phosphoglycerate dehydrogenase
MIENNDYLVPSANELLFQKNTASFYPKDKINVLLLENVHPGAVKLFKDAGYRVEFHKEALDEDTLCKKISNVAILGIRSKTLVTEKVLQNAPKLLAVGAFCIGTEQINLTGCLKRDIVVFNAPYSNTRSVVELAIGEMILLMRNIASKNEKLHAGEWDKSAGHSNEILGKKLGLVGYGNISRQLSMLAESLGMEVYYYDVAEKPQRGNAKKCQCLHDLLKIADVVSLHIDGCGSNKNLIGAAEFAVMKQGVVFLNLARGHLVDIDAFVKFHQQGKFRGAAFDVYPYEPESNDERFETPLRGLPNVILTPHIGGSTEEAQYHIGQFVPSHIIRYVNTGDKAGSVNFPAVQ